MEITYFEDEISNVAKEILAAAPMMTFLFYGEMGVGKTRLIKELVKQLGITEIAGSPTFSLVNEYKSATLGSVYHFDFYRIEHIEEAYDIGLEEYMDGENYVFIEWPEKISAFLAKENANTIYITKNKNGSRNLKLMPVK